MIRAVHLAGIRPAQRKEPGMITLYDNESGARLGTIDDDQLAFLQAHLVEESLEDTDYFIMAPTVDLMESEGASAALITLLRGAIGGRDGVDLRWEQSS